jgi:hypothetical protein
LGVVAFLTKAVTGVSQPGVGLESAYSGPRVELRPPVNPSPVFRASPTAPSVPYLYIGAKGVAFYYAYWYGMRT